MQTQISPELFIQNPYAVFAMARQKSPILKTEIFQIYGWLITGFKEVEAVLKDSRFIREAGKIYPSDQMPEIPKSIMPAIQLNRNMMLFRDAPDHTRLRTLVNKAFTPRMVEKLRPSIIETTDYLIENMKGKTEHELIHDFAYLLPVIVITELLGVQKEDRDQFRKWSDAFVTFIDLSKTYSDMEKVTGDILEASQYIRNLINQRRQNPKEDLISSLIAVEEAGDKLNEDELIATCLLLLIAGHETTVNLITNGYYLLLKNQDQFNTLKNDLSLIPSAVEEILRYESPVIMTLRWASEDFEFLGHPIQRGDTMVIALGGANYDPSITENPFEFDITRKNIKHLSFSSGAHFCLGAPLARLEAQIALEKLMTHLHNPSLIEEPIRRTNVAFRGFEGLKIRAEVK